MYICVLFPQVDTIMNMIAYCQNSTYGRRAAELHAKLVVSTLQLPSKLCCGAETGNERESHGTKPSSPLRSHRVYVHSLPLLPSQMSFSLSLPFRSTCRMCATSMSSRSSLRMRTTRRLISHCKSSCPVVHTLTLSEIRVAAQWHSSRLGPTQGLDTYTVTFA